MIRIILMVSQFGKGVKEAIPWALHDSDGMDLCGSRSSATVGALVLSLLVHPPSGRLIASVSCVMVLAYLCF